MVRDSEGRPVAAARVKVVQLRHAFSFGSGLFLWGKCGNPEREQEYRDRFASLFNSATLVLLWDEYERERGKPDYAHADAASQWCKDQGIVCNGHPLIWDAFRGPDWLPQSFSGIQALAHGHVRDTVSHYKGRIDSWYVVNEPTHLGVNATRLGTWAMSLGPVPYVAQFLQTARAANPAATLLVNDYRTDLQYLNILNRLRQPDGKLLFDAVGLQSHMHEGYWRLDRIRRICDTFAQLGAPIHFTETTVLSGPRIGSGDTWGPTTPELEERQADYVSAMYTTLFAHPGVESVTWWDFTDAGAWKGAAAGLIRDDFSPKPAYKRLLELIKGQWWTRDSGFSSLRGEFKLRAFYGRHRIEILGPGGRRVTREVDWQRGSPNRFEITL